MIIHTVCFSLVHTPDSSEEQEFLKNATNTLSGIPGVQNFEVSRQISNKSPHSFQFSMTFDDTDAYTSYDVHPDHVEFVATRWAKEVAEFQELDFKPYG